MIQRTLIISPKYFSISTHQNIIEEDDILVFVFITFIVNVFQNFNCLNFFPFHKDALCYHNFVRKIITIKLSRK